MLNLDILHNIMSFSDRTSTSRLMRTCRILNHEGAKHLLRDTPWLRTEAEAISFTQYAFARANVDETAHRMYWLRGLHIGKSRSVLSCKSRRFIRTMALFFLRFVVHAPNFVELDLRNSEELFSADRGFSKVVSAAVRLQNLALNNASLHALNMLRHSSLRLSSAQIGTTNSAEEEPSVNDHPILALHNSQDTLRVLTLERVAFDPDRSMPCYHNLVRLDLASRLVPPIYHLAEIFPNLRTLNVDTRTGYSYLNVPTREEQRQASILGQAQHGTFRTLRTYTGSILSLYLFAPTCRIPFLELRDDEDESCWDMRMLQAVCAQARPAHLALYISCLHDWPSEADGFVRLCGSESLKTTRTLTLNFDIMWGTKDVDLGPVLECVYTAVRGSSVRAVELVLDWQQYWYNCFDDDEELNSKPLPSAEVFLRSVDVEAVADRLFEATKTLETAIVRLWTWDEPEVKVQRGPDIDYSDIN